MFHILKYSGGVSVLSALEDLATRPTTAFVEPYDPSAPKVAFAEEIYLSNI